MKDKIDLLIEILFDPSASIAERDDAGMDLGDFDDDRALKALSSFVLNHNAEPSIMDVCGESLAQIWVKRNQFDKDVYKKMHPYAQHEADMYLKANKSDWLSDARDDPT